MPFIFMSNILKHHRNILITSDVTMSVSLIWNNSYVYHYVYV